MTWTSSPFVSLLSCFVLCVYAVCCGLTEENWLKYGQLTWILVSGTYFHTESARCIQIQLFCLKFAMRLHFFVLQFSVLHTESFPFSSLTHTLTVSSKCLLSILWLLFWLIGFTLGRNVNKSMLPFLSHFPYFLTCHRKSFEYEDAARLTGKQGTLGVEARRSGLYHAYSDDSIYEDIACELFLWSQQL